MTSSERPNSSTTISLEDLVALNEEIVSLSRAGIPLEMGLRGFGTNLRGRLGKIATDLATQMSNGRSLPEALEAEGHRFPPVYRAVVAAGLKAGRLPEAIESLTDSVQTLLEVRRRIALSFVYPICVLILAYGLFIGFILAVVPQIQTTYQMFQIPLGASVTALITLHETIVWWGPVAPLLPAGLIVWWKVSENSMLFAGRKGRGGLLQGFPGVRYYHLANFADMLGLLVTHSVPLHEAFRLAADMTGQKPLVADAARIAERLEAGDSVVTSLKAASALPPFMIWMISTAEGPQALVSTLRQAAEMYRRRATTLVEWFHLAFPLALVVVLGGTVTLIYALALFMPLLDMLSKMGLD